MSRELNPYVKSNGGGVNSQPGGTRIAPALSIIAQIAKQTAQRQSTWTACLETRGAPSTSVRLSLSLSESGRQEIAVYPPQPCDSQELVYRFKLPIYAQLNQACDRARGVETLNPAPTITWRASDG
jgi:hypothetical protein